MQPEQTTKSLAMQAIEQLPDDATLDDIVDGILLRMKVERGRAQITAGEGIPHEEVTRRLARWLT